MRLIVVTLTANKLPDYPTSSFIDWQGFCEFFGLVSNLTCHIRYQGCIHQQGRSGVAPEAMTPCQSLLHQSKPRLALAGASRGGKEGAQCHHCSLTADSNPRSAPATVSALMRVHCSLTLSLSAMGLLSFHQNLQPVRPNSRKKYHSK